MLKERMNEGSSCSKLIRHRRWKPVQDNILIDGLASGVNKWPCIAKLIPGKSAIECRERWETYLEGFLKEGRWSKEEDQQLVRAFNRWGDCWHKISREIPGRSDRACFHRWKAVLLCEEIQIIDEGMSREESNKNFLDSSTKPFKDLGSRENTPHNKNRRHAKNNPSDNTSSKPQDSKKIDLDKVQEPDQAESDHIQEDLSDQEKQKKQNPTIVHVDSAHERNQNNALKEHNLQEKDIKKRKKKEEKKHKKDRQNNRPSRSRAAIAERERERSLQQQRDVVSKQELFDSRPLTKKEEHLIRRAYSFGFTQGHTGKRAKNKYLAQYNVASRKLKSKTAVKERAFNLLDVSLLQWEFYEPSCNEDAAADLFSHFSSHHGLNSDLSLRSCFGPLYLEAQKDQKN